MKLQEIRRNAELVSSIRKISEEPAFRVLLEMLEDEHPRKGQDLPAGSSVFDVARIHDRQTGYELALANIRNAGDYVKPHQEVKQDYEKETL